jgi:hypothetical protein
MGIRLHLQRLVLYKPSLIDMEGVIVIFFGSRVGPFGGEREWSDLM